MIASKYIDAPESIGDFFKYKCNQCSYSMFRHCIITTNQSIMALSLQLLIAYLSYYEGVINPSQYYRCSCQHILRKFPNNQQLIEDHIFQNFQFNTVMLTIIHDVCLIRIINCLPFARIYVHPRVFLRSLSCSSSQFSVLCYFCLVRLRSMSCAQCCMCLDCQFFILISI